MTPFQPPGSVVEPEEAGDSIEPETRTGARSSLPGPTTVPQLQPGQGRAREQRTPAKCPGLSLINILFFFAMDDPLKS